jgi:5-methylcytosine-specific restriction endonuclease McrA
MDSILTLLLIALFFIAKFAYKAYNRKKREDYYHEYHKSEAWQRKRYLVLKRDNYRCVRCGANATQVHHLKYAKWNIGKEPIDWLVSLCNECHKKEHSGWGQ